MAEIANTVGVLCGVVISVWIWKLINLIWIKPKKLQKYLTEKAGFKGNKYKLLFGDTKELAVISAKARSKPINFFDSDSTSVADDVLRRSVPYPYHAFHKYGKTFMIWLGWRPQVHIMDPDLIKDILVNSNDFRKRKFNPLLSFLLPGLVSYEGEQWAKHRKLINPAFHVGKLKNMVHAFEISCSAMIEKWDVNGSLELDVWPQLQALTCDAIARTSFGSSYEEGMHIFTLLKEQTELLLPVLQSVYIPGMRYLPTKRYRRMRAINKKINQSLINIVDKRLKAIKVGEGKSDDLLGIMLESNLREVEQHGHKSHGMTIDEVVEECKLFYFAGQETTASLLVWTMILLSKHQEWQSRAREEVLGVFNNRKVNAEGLNHLRVVTMILHEVLRQYPPVVALARETYKEIKLGGLTLPAGVFIGLPMMLLHYDQEFWGADVKEFKPERFSEGVSKATKNQPTYFPFGGGPRICIGQNFTMLEAKIALVMMLQNFSFQLSPSYVHAPHIVLMLQPQYGAHLILRKI